MFSTIDNQCLIYCFVFTIDPVKCNYKFINIAGNNNQDMIEILDKYLAELGLDDNNVTKQSTMGIITPSPITAISTGE